MLRRVCGARKQCEDVYAGLIKSCREARNVEKGRGVHQQITESELGRDSTYLANLLMQMYSKCDRVEEAREVFDGIKEPNSCSWNTIIAAYARAGDPQLCKICFDSAAHRNEISWSSLLNIYIETDNSSAKELLRRIPKLDDFTWTAMIRAYVDDGQLQSAKNTFDNMPERNLFCWTTLLSGSFLDPVMGKRLIEKMPKHDAVSWTALITACFQAGDHEEAMNLFLSMPQRCVVSWNAMITGYYQNGFLGQAEKLFEKMPMRSLVSWNGVIVAYSYNGDLTKAQRSFRVMPVRDFRSWTAMIAAYADNGDLPSALKLFEEFPFKTVTAWNSIMGSYAKSGLSHEASEVFRLMLLEGVNPDSISFTHLLAASSHEGLVEQCRCCLVSMVFDHGLKLVRDHYSSLIAALARSGQLEEAGELMSKMPLGADAAASWRALFGVGFLHCDDSFALNGVSDQQLTMLIDELKICHLF